MPTVHNPTLFRPEDYDVVDYFDNQCPKIEYFGLNIKAYEYAVQQYRIERDFLFPDKNDHQCQHCGQRNVRYVVACLHKPTGKHVCFGDVCVVRLDFTNQNAFKAAQIRSRAAAGHARMKIYAQRSRYLQAHPEVEQLIKDLESPVHDKNSFAKDVLSKLDRYGSLSDRQLECVKSSMARDLEFAAKKAAEIVPTELAPEGRAAVEGEILSRKGVEGIYGYQTKVLIKLTNGNKVWGSLPNSLDGCDKGDRIKFTASFERKTDDLHFAFFKRPSKASHVELVT